MPAETRTTLASMVCDSPPLAGSTVSLTTSPSLDAPVTCAAARSGHPFCARRMIECHTRLLHASSTYAQGSALLHLGLLKQEY